MLFKRIILVGLSLVLFPSCSKTDSSIEYGFNYDNDKSMSRYFMGFKAEKRIIEENESLDFYVYYGHNFYTDDGRFLPRREEAKFCLTITEGDNILSNLVFEDFYSEEYDCLKNNNIDYKNNYEKVTFSWFDLETKNSESIMYWVKLKRENSDAPLCRMYFTFTKEDNRYVLKVGSED